MRGAWCVFSFSVKDVQRFFQRRHPCSYRLYNLCSERKYDAAKFEGSVARFPFDDHNPCPFDMLKAFCEDVRQWLAEHPQNVAAIHCKAGKGRTGTVIAAFLLYSRKVERAFSLASSGCSLMKRTVGVLSAKRRWKRWTCLPLSAPRTRKG